MRKPVFVLLMIFCYFSQCPSIFSATGDSAGENTSPAAGGMERKSYPDDKRPADRDHRTAVPPAIFSMTVQRGIFKDTPWPPMPIAGIRLWDTFTIWSMIEPSRGKYDWPALDRWLVEAKVHGVDVLYTFGATPAWASSNPKGKCEYNDGGCYPPANMQDWDDYVHAIATHAAGRIKYWEIWNEGDQHEYWSGGVPALVTMTQHAYKIIKAIDPQAIIFTPSGVGGARDVSTFLDKFFAEGGGAYVDGVAFHGYVNSNPSSPEEVDRIVDAVRGAMAKWGQGSKPLWDTEGSWGPADHLPNEEDQSAFLARFYLLQWSKNVQRMYWYAWNDDKWGTLWDVPTRRMRRPALVYREVEDWLTGAVSTSPCAVASGSVWTCSLTLANGAQALIVWDSSASSSVTIPFRPAPIFVRYENLDGTTAPISGGTAYVGMKPILLTASAPHLQDHAGGQGSSIQK